MPQTFTATFREDALCLALAAPRRPPVVIFALLWACGWALTVAVLALDMIRHPDIELEGNVLWLAFWVLAGGAVGFVLLWLAGGQREAVRADAGGVRLRRQAGPFWWTTSMDASAIQTIEIRDAVRRRPIDVAPVARFWSGDLGRISFLAGRRRTSMGEALSDAEARDIVTLLQARLAHVPVGQTTGGARRSSRPRYAAGAVSALIAGALVWPAATIPARLALIDRSICFANDAVPPARPAEVVSPAGRSLYLVPLDDVRREDVERIAQALRDRYGVRIDVSATTAAVDAYDPRRRQLNAEALVAALGRWYPSATAVVIGITHRDMYIPGFGWRYAFSYRRAGRLAVVSTARMERGCLGLFAASAERRAARLRKMIAKNIGVLYFSLPLSDDPRSLMYAYVGGPQELDAMSETF